MKMNFIAVNFWCYSWTANMYNRCKSFWYKKKEKKICGCRRELDECISDEPIVVSIVVQIPLCFVMLFFSRFFFLYLVFISFRNENQQTLLSWQRQSLMNRLTHFIYLYFVLNNFSAWAWDEFQVFGKWKKKKRKWTSAPNGTCI